MIAACLLGLGRALGEAIAVSQVIGGGTESHLSLFKTGGTMASIIALQFPSAGQRAAHRPRSTTWRRCCW